MSDWLVYGSTAFLESFWYFIVFLAGAIVGSFLGVVIYRLPIIVLTEPRPKDFTLSTPASFCPHCRHKLSWWENTPVLGFLILRGRCFQCRKPIPWRDFAMEILTASVWLALFHRYNEGNLVSWISFVCIALFASMLIAAVFIDLDHFIIPDEMNWFGIVVGVLRDVVCIALLYAIAGPLREEYLREFAYFGWLPRAIPGALLYGGVLWLVSLVGFLYYARVPWETAGSAVRRFFSYADAPEPPAEWQARIDAEEAALKAEAEAQGISLEEEEGDPVRLRFSPGFIVLMAALFLAFVVKWWAILAFVLPLVAFVALTRTPEETAGDAVRRFFRADDLPYQYEDLPFGEPHGAAAIKPDPPVITAAGPDGWITMPPPGAEASPVEETPPQDAPAAAASPYLMTVAEAQADADQFAREAETGAHGGMGMGDVKLALAIGAILGPFPAILSLLTATLVGAVTGIVLMRVHKKGTLRYGLPFVPFMAAGALLVMLFGRQAVDWYLSTMMPKAETPPAAVRPAQPFPPGRGAPPTPGVPPPARRNAPAPLP